VTPLEALALGVPVVASRLPAFVEALGDAATLVDDDACVREPDILSDAIRAAIEHRDDGLAAARRDLVAREFTWERCARETLAGWRALS
jgi:glycosyltransferase involved in cell wall biosynthesis